MKIAKHPEKFNKSENGKNVENIDKSENWREQKRSWRNTANKLTNLKNRKAKNMNVDNSGNFGNMNIEKNIKAHFNPFSRFGKITEKSIKKLGNQKFKPIRKKINAKIWEVPTASQQKCEECGQPLTKFDTEECPRCGIQFQ